MTDWTIEPFAKHHERTAFSCGQPTLDDFIRTRVSQYEKRRLGKTFVAVAPGDRRVLGYYTLAASSISFANVPDEASRKLPRHPVPVVLLARLAVDRSAQGKGMGEGLLLDALQRSLALSSELGVYAVEVEAIDESAAAFYFRYGFQALPDHSRHLYLPMATIERVLQDSGK